MTKQTPLHSFFESLNAALASAPTALLLNKFILIIAGQNALNENQDLFVISSWSMFFIHSIIWKFIIRLIHEKYGVRLDPIHIVKYIKSRINK